MPAPDQYRSTNWYVDPETGELQQVVHGQVVETSGSLSEISGGLLSSGPGYIRDSTTGRFAWGTTANYPTFLNISSQGWILVSREAAESEVNSEIFSRARYGSVASGEIVLPDGSVERVETTSWLTRAGDRLIVKEDTLAGQSGRYAYTQDFASKGVAAPTEPPPGWVHADPATTITRGLVGQIIKEYRGLIDDMIAMGYKDADGNAITDTYDAAMVIKGSLDMYHTVASVLAV